MVNSIICSKFSIKINFCLPINHIYLILSLCAYNISDWKMHCNKTCGQLHKNSNFAKAQRHIACIMRLCETRTQINGGVDFLWKDGLTDFYHGNENACTKRYNKIAKLCYSFLEQIRLFCRKALMICDIRKHKYSALAIYIYVYIYIYIYIYIYRLSQAIWL